MAHEVAVTRVADAGEGSQPVGRARPHDRHLRDLHHVYWWYTVNRELRDLGQAAKARGSASSTNSCLASVFGIFTLYVATVWTYVAGTRRGRRAQELAGLQPYSGWVMVAALAIFTLGIECPVCFQAQLNRVWATMPAIGPAPVAASNA